MVIRLVTMVVRPSPPRTAALVTARMHACDESELGLVSCAIVTCQNRWYQGEHRTRAVDHGDGSHNRDPRALVLLEH
jgi:hypothetical protein